MIICIDDSDDDASSSDTDQDQAKLRPSSALHYPGHETKNSQNDEKEESEEYEVFDRKTFDSEQEEDIRQDAGEALPDVEWIDGPTEHRVDEGDPEEYSESDLSEKYSETSDAAHDYQGTQGL